MKVRGREEGKILISLLIVVIVFWHIKRRIGERQHTVIAWQYEYWLEIRYGCIDLSSFAPHVLHKSIMVVYTTRSRVVSLIIRKPQAGISVTYNQTMNLPIVNSSCEKDWQYSFYSTYIFIAKLRWFPHPVLHTASRAEHCDVILLHWQLISRAQFQAGKTTASINVGFMQKMLMIE